MFDRVMRCTGSLRSGVGRVVVGCVLAAGLAGPAAAQTVTSAFTYQGQLKDGNGPINGTADLIVTLFNAQSGGSAVGTANNLNNVEVVDGLFTVVLDFGGNAVAGDARWVEIAVRSPAGSGAYTTLTPRQPLTAAPLAWYAMRAREAQLPWQTTSEGGYWLSLPTNLGQINGVGLGTGPSPAARLHVRTGAFFPATAVLIEDGFARSQLKIGTPESEGRATLQAWNAQTNTAGPLGLNVGGGGVGIGTGAPTSTLDVAGNFETDAFKLNGNGAAAGRVLVSDAAGVGTWQAQGAASQWTTNGTNIGYLGAGNVGIGTTTPNAGFRLHITGGSGAWRGAMAATGTTNSAVMGEANGVATIGGHNAALTAWSNLSINPGGGNVGIGTITPASKLDVFGVVTSDGLVVAGDGQIDGELAIGRPSADMVVDVRANDIIGTSATAISQHDASNRGNKASFGYRIFGSASEFVGMRTLVAAGTNGCGNTGDIRFDTWECQTSVSREVMRITGGGEVGIGTSTPAAKLDVIGTARVSVLQITGGSDVAEPFNVNQGRGNGEQGTEKIAPGMVVTIDPDRVGELRVSGKAYDKTVAGIISGANGINPGMVLSQTGTVADGKHPVALTGRVWCWCDADAGGAISAGDMLTTSGTPGHAMRAADQDRAHGAVIGKAMSALESGKGMVLVLVNLQ